MGDAGRLCARDHRSKPLDLLGPTSLGPGNRGVDGRTSSCSAQLGCVPTALLQLVKGSELIHDHHSPGFCSGNTCCHFADDSPTLQTLLFLLLLSGLSANSLCW